MKWILALVLIIASYLLGNISPSTILAKRSGHDIKSEGSGNAGTTNALRVLGAKAALITLIVDVGKGFLATWISYRIMFFYGENYVPIDEMGGVWLAETVSAWCGLAVFLGHIWPVLLGFKGGKGVATAFGVLLAIDWVSALICLGIVIVVVVITRMVSLGSILAALCFPFIWLYRILAPATSDAPLVIDSFSVGLFSVFIGPMFLPLIIMVVLLLVKHRANIGRIIKGEENKISFNKNKE